jgi:sugar transferase (PEP-CTERM/EpsH1 system associated)
VKILCLCQRIPFPPDRGDRILAYHQIKRLRDSHNVIVGSLANPGSQSNAEKLETELGIKLIAPNHSVLQRAIGTAASLLRDKPLSLGYFWNSKLQHRLDSEVKNRPVDAIIAFSSSMAQYAERYKQTPRIMHFCDLDSQKWEELAEQSNGLMRWIYRREHRLLLEYERKIASEFSNSCVVSDNEADLFRKQVPGVAVHVLENGVDTDYFGAVPRRDGDLRIVFVGVMDYAPNVEAVSFFAERVWNRILMAYPRARFMIIGSNPTSKVRKLARFPGIQVTGHVSDVRPYLASATLAVVPLAVARGVQNKVLEAMAANVPVLTTPCVAKGLPVGAEKHIFVAEREPEAFSLSLLKLIKNRPILEQTARAACDFVNQQCTWDIKLRILDELLQEATAGKADKTSFIKQDP